MTEETDLTAARNLAFQKIGRNIANFQRLEVLLKYLFKIANFSQPVSKLEAHFSSREAAIRSRPFGEVVSRTAQSYKSDPPAAPPDIQEAWISFSISLWDNKQGALAWRRQMEQLVSDRNRVVHRLSEWADLGTVKGCTQLCAELDAQRERLLPAYEQLRLLILKVAEHGKFIADNADELVEKLMAESSSHDA